VPLRTIYNNKATAQQQYESKKAFASTIYSKSHRKQKKSRHKERPNVCTEVTQETASLANHHCTLSPTKIHWPEIF
jgi:hypothetical protein